MDKLIPHIVDTTSCGKHEVPPGIPCFGVELSTVENGYSPGICNARAKLAGFNGKISPGALRKK